VSQPIGSECCDVLSTLGHPAHRFIGPGDWVGYAPRTSRWLRRTPPIAAAATPRPVMIAALVQSRLVAGAGTMWKHTDLSSSQRLTWVSAPMNSSRKDQVRLP